MGCTMGTPLVDGEAMAANATPSRVGLFGRQVLPPSSALLSKKTVEREFSPGSPSFRCYIKKEDQDTKLNNASKMENSSPAASTSPTSSPNQEIESKGQKKEKGWMPKGLHKKTGDSGNVVPIRQSNN